MDEFREWRKQNRLAYINKYEEFQRVFGVPLSKFWDKQFGFDIVAFDEKFIKPNDNESTKQATLRKYGQEGLDLIVALLHA